jgi:hypothetical protein
MAMRAKTWHGNNSCFNPRTPPRGAALLARTTPLGIFLLEEEFVVEFRITGQLRGNLELQHHA